jgi:hypothetical protein
MTVTVENHHVTVEHQGVVARELQAVDKKLHHIRQFKVTVTPL